MEEKRNNALMFVLWARLCLVGAGVCFLIMLLAPHKKLTLAIWLGLFVFFFAVYIPIYAWSYRAFINKTEDGKSLTIKSGVFIRSERTIGISNIEYVKVSIGPIQRIFGDLSLCVYTAGASLVVRGLRENSPLKTELCGYFNRDKGEDNGN